jgi:hypothetical protein
MKIGAKMVRHGRYVTFQLALACRDGDSTTVVRGNPATDCRPATEGGADVTRRVIVAIGLNRRAQV